jgi:hypothetical protein
LHEDALKLAGDTATAIEIEHGLAQVRKIAGRQRVLGALSPISSAPSLYTFNTFGFTVYGNSDYDAETRSYVTTHYFVALFIPIFPIARYRVIHETGGQYRFLGKLPLRVADRWHLWIAIIAIAAVIIGGVINSDKTSSSSSARFGNNSPSNFGTTSSPSFKPSAAPSSRNSQLSSLKAQIDAGRTRHAVIEQQLQPVVTQLARMKEQLNSLKTELEALDESEKRGQTIDLENYNNEVNVHNALLARYQALLSTNRADLETLDKLEKQDSALVNQYNALLKR